MRWQEPARVAIALFAAIFAGVVFFATSNRRTPSPGAPVERTDPDAAVESTKGTVTRAKGQKQDFRLDYERVLMYEKGATKFEKVSVHVPQRAGRSFVISGQRGEVAEGPARIKIEGDVRLSASDGLTARTEQASYDETEGIVRAPGRFEFERGGLSGSGLGATYDSNRDVLWLLEQAHIVVAPEHPADESANVTAGTAGFARRDKYLRFERDVKVIRSGRIMEADTATAYLSQDEKRIETIELRGHSRITGSGTGPGALQSMNADNMNLNYHEDGKALRHATLTGKAVIQLSGSAGQQSRRISAESIDLEFSPAGTVVTGIAARNRLELEFPAEGSVPARKIRGNSLEGTGGPDGGLTSLKVVDSVEYRETGAASETKPAVDRSARARLLSLGMQPGMSAIDEASFAGDTTFKEGDLAAQSGHARYDLGRGLLELTTPKDLEGPIPRVSDERITIQAETINLTLEGHKMIAQGDVRSVLQPRKKNTAVQTAASPEMHVPALLKQDLPINVTSQRLAYDGSVSRAEYAGNAKLWQGETAIQGDMVALDDRTGNLQVRGSARSTLLLEHTNATAKTSERVAMIASAREMTYDDEKRRATYTTGAHTNGPQGDLTADTIDIYLDSTGASLERAEAFGAITLRLEKRSATGEHMTYYASGERYVMSGKPVSIVEECRESTGETLTFFKSTDSISVDGNGKIRTETRTGDKCPEPR